MKALSGAASVARHSLGAVTEALLIAAIVAALALALSPLYGPARFITGTGSVDAAKGGGHGGGNTTSGVTISVPDGTFGSSVVATVKGGAPWVHVTCFQGGGIALTDWERTDANGQTPIGLGPTASWSSGAATCSAEAGHFNNRSKWVIDATTSFDVSG
jgi:hypothetical protein